MRGFALSPKNIFHESVGERNIIAYITSLTSTTPSKIPHFAKRDLCPFSNPNTIGSARRTCVLSAARRHSIQLQSGGCSAYFVTSIQGRRMGPGDSGIDAGSRGRLHAGARVRGIAFHEE